MRMLKWAASVALATAFATSVASAEDYKIGYSVFWGTNPFLVTMVNGAKKSAEEWKAKGVNVDLIVTNGGDTDKAKQVSDLEDLNAQGVDGVLIFPGDSVMVAEPIKNTFNAQDIPVVITDIGIRSGKYESLIITDNYKGGQQAADYMATLFPKGSKVVTLDHAPTNDNGQTRQKGFEDRAKELGLEVLPEQPVAFLTLDAGRQSMEDLLVSEPDVKGAFAFNQLVIQGAYQALEQAKKAGEVKLIGFDLDPVSYKMVQDGKIDALVVQDPYKMGYEGMNIVLTKLGGGEVPRDIGLGTKLLTKANAAEFAEDPQVTGK
ncbi:substrate-binding domain-containing protein [Mesorhizobium sp. LHD-90]|uniref:substrate-binding domain-containing protein n=1 Tax=Mesorhizobium sp. LHD-90 TaxID=3071414 RepID=UPI0027E15C1A|nr:substrate-binding domain-containing protein [Mesorhizobium sp. LHD-90]MDQ6435734.1 substrate-binding domain-containing protein [Mesorhizobium sp. LHD-90]